MMHDMMAAMVDDTPVVDRMMDLGCCKAGQGKK
jgi:hypothetical protein